MGSVYILCCYKLEDRAGHMISLKLEREAGVHRVWVLRAGARGVSRYGLEGKGGLKTSNTVLLSAAYLLVPTPWTSLSQVSSEICCDRRASHACPSGRKPNLFLRSLPWPLCPEIRPPMSSLEKPPDHLPLLTSFRERSHEL